MADDRGGEIIELTEQPRRARTRRSDTQGVRGLAERVTESVWTRGIGRLSIMACAGLLSLNLWFAQDKYEQFRDDLRDLHADQAKLAEKIEGIDDTLNAKMADVIANQAAGLADRNAQAGQIADLKQQLDRQVDWLGARISRMGDKMFEMLQGRSKQ